MNKLNKIPELDKKIKARFLHLKNIVFAKPHESDMLKKEIRKSFLKSLIVSDKEINCAVNDTVKRYLGEYNFQENYCIYHFTNDSFEKGKIHRDGNSSKRRVVWYPITEYKYEGISFNRHTENILSRFFLYFQKYFKADLLTDTTQIGDGFFYSWDPRLNHRGNFNSSDQDTCAIQFILAKDKKSSFDVEEYSHHSDEYISSTLKAIEEDINYQEKSFSNPQKLINLFSNKRQISFFRQVINSRLDINL